MDEGEQWWISVRIRKKVAGIKMDRSLAQEIKRERRESRQGKKGTRLLSASWERVATLGDSVLMRPQFTEAEGEEERKGKEKDPAIIARVRRDDDLNLGTHCGMKGMKVLLYRDAEAYRHVLVDLRSTEFNLG